MSDKLSFLGGEQPPEPEVVSAAEAAQAVVAAETPVAGETPAVQPPPAQATAIQTLEPGQAPSSAQVPISALLDEREKRQAERAAREGLERQLAAISARIDPPGPEAAIQAALYQQNLRSSRRFAEREHGKEAVATLHDWAARRCDEDPHFNRQMRAAEDPYEAAHKAYHREQILRTVKPDDLAAFKAWQASYAKASEAGASHHSLTHTATPVPRTLATAPGNGGAGVTHVPVGPGQAFAATLNR